MQIEVTSPAFSAGGVIPKRYTGEGEDLSPELRWSKLPDGAKELMVICEDPDAPGDEPWVHWSGYKIPAAIGFLPEGFAQQAPAGVLQGKNSWGSPGWRGPFPPKGHGRHRYLFTVYALDAALDLRPGMDRAALLGAVKGHVLASGSLQGSFERR